MKLIFDLALLLAIFVWAVLEFYFKTEFGALNALILFGIILRFGVMAARGTAEAKQTGGRQ